MKTALTLTALLTSATAFAHPGHVETVAGHDHLSTLVVPGLIIAGVLAVGFFIAKRRAR